MAFHQYRAATMHRTQESGLGEKKEKREEMRGKRKRAKKRDELRARARSDNNCNVQGGSRLFSTGFDNFDFNIFPHR